MSFPYSYSVLGLVPGIILTVVQAGFVLYTSLVVWFVFLLPTRDTARSMARATNLIKGILFASSRGPRCLRHWADAFLEFKVGMVRHCSYVFAQQHFHSRSSCACDLSLSKHDERYVPQNQNLKQFWPTLELTNSGHGVCTVGFAAIGAVASWLCSMPRTFNTLSKLAAASAVFTFISVILAAAFAGAEGKHGTAGYNPDPNFINANGKNIGGEPIVLVIPAAGTTFVSGMNAFLNISYTFIGQITLPSFIAEMKNPYDFRKALWLVTICEIIVFSLVGGIGAYCPSWS